MPKETLLDPELLPGPPRVELRARGAGSVWACPVVTSSWFLSSQVSCPPWSLLLSGVFVTLLVPPGSKGHVLLTRPRRGLCTSYGTWKPPTARVTRTGLFLSSCGVPGSLSHPVLSRYYSHLPFHGQADEDDEGQCIGSASVQTPVCCRHPVTPSPSPPATLSLFPS